MCEKDEFSEICVRVDADACKYSKHILYVLDSLKLNDERFAAPSHHQAHNQRSNSVCLINKLNFMNQIE